MKRNELRSLPATRRMYHHAQLAYTEPVKWSSYWAVYRDAHGVEIHVLLCASYSAPELLRDLRDDQVWIVQVWRGPNLVSEWANFEIA